ncbi:MAG: RDD family protein [Chloroflexota bacterium]
MAPYDVDYWRDARNWESLDRALLEAALADDEVTLLRRVEAATLARVPTATIERAYGNARDVMPLLPPRGFASSSPKVNSLDRSKLSMIEWLELLRDGAASQQIEARFALAAEFERRRQLDEAVELLESNVASGVRTSSIYFRLARLYRVLGRLDLADKATLEAHRLQSHAHIAATDSLPQRGSTDPRFTHNGSSRLAEPIPPSDAISDTLRTSEQGGNQRVENVASVEPGLAPIWRRGAALVIDLILIGIAYLLVVGVMAVVSEGQSTNPVVMRTIELLIQAGTMIVYGTVLEGSSVHATIGKALLSIRVTNEDGRPPSVGQALGRNCIKALTGPKFTFWLLSAFSVWRDKENRTWHDKAAHTVVRRARRD